VEAQPPVIAKRYKKEVPYPVVDSREKRFHTGDSVIISVNHPVWTIVSINITVAEAFY